MDVTQDQFFSGVQMVRIQSFPSLRIVAISRQDNILSNYIAGGRRDGFMPFTMVSARGEA